MMSDKRKATILKESLKIIDELGDIDNIEGDDTLEKIYELIDKSKKLKRLKEWRLK